MQALYRKVMAIDKLVYLTVLGFSFVANVVLFTYWYQSYATVNKANDYVIAQQKYPLISKHVLQEKQQDIIINFLSLQKKLRSEVEPYGEKFGMYFEYLPTGTSIGINSTSQFYAASLFKVPIVMAYYDRRERLNLVDDPMIEVKPDQIDKQFGNLWEKGSGYKLRASEAVRLALVDSDNTAIKALIPYISQEDFDDVYKSLDIDLYSDTKGAHISARTYATVLKALYFSSVLNYDDSQQILDLLTQTKFSDKIVAGVPKGTLVAHKIGDFKDTAGNSGYRDCGIVYVPKRPYILCTFSVSDEQTANDRMEIVSRSIYNFVSTAQE